MGCMQKTIGIVLAATFAMSAVVCPAASAEFTTGSDSTTLTAESLGNNQVLTLGESQLTCTEISVDASAVGTVQTEITVEPTYNKCSVSLGSLGTPEAKVDTNKCHFLFTTQEAVAMHITCATEGATQIEITAKILGTFRKCLDIHAQTPTFPALHYRNKTNPATGKMDLEIESTVSGITFEKTGSCAFGTLEDNEGAYSSRITLKGDSTGSAVDVTHSLFPS